MAKIHRVAAGEYVFHCPGCRHVHQIWTAEARDRPFHWDFNESLDEPTFHPSLLVNGDLSAPFPRCHTFIRDGMIQYLPDCTHNKANQTIKIPEWNGWEMEYSE